MKKICPECNKIFITELEEKGYCDRKCSVEVGKGNKRKKK